MIKFSLPRDTYTPIKFAGHLTTKDVIRLIIPTALIGFFTYTPESLISTLTGVAFGLLIGISWIFYRPEGKPVDVHLYNLVRQKSVSHWTENTELETVGRRAAVTEQGVAVAVVKVQPVSLTMQDEDDQKALHSILSELYETVSFPIEIHSRQLPLRLDSYINNLEKTDNNTLRSDYIEFCKQFNHGDNSTTHHYIVVKTTPSNLTHLQEFIDQLRQNHEKIDSGLKTLETRLPIELHPDTDTEPSLGELDHRANIVQDVLSRGPLEAEHLTDVEFQQYVHSFNREIIPGRTSYRIPEARIGAYRKPVYIDEFPSSARLGWTVDLLNQGSNGRVDLIQRVEPRNQSKAVRTLERHIQRLEAEINSRLGGGLIKDITALEAKKEDAEQMLDLCADNSQSLVDYSAYLTVHGETREKQKRAFNEVTTRLDTLLADAKKPVYRTDQAFQTESALHEDPLHESTLMPSSSAAAGFPFATSNRNEGTGIIYGTSTEDQAPVLLDQWKWTSYATAVLGRTGSGKSFFVKTLLLRWKQAYNNIDQVIVVDPKNEYGNIIQQLNGTQNILKPGTDCSFDDDVLGFQVKERGQQNNVEQLIDLIRSIYTQTSQNKKKTIVVIDEAHNILRRQEGREVLEQFVREARDTQTAVAMISQNASDFTSNLEGRNILKNTEAVFLMRHSEVADDVVDFFQLSQTERTELRKLKTGTEGSYSESLMKISDRLDTKIRVEATAREKQQITEGEQR